MKYFLLCSLFLAACASRPPVVTPSAKGPAPTVDHRRVQRLELTGDLTAGTTTAGQVVPLGGFSGLRFLGKSGDGRLRFLTLTDRGPNASEEEDHDRTFRPFVLPAYQPSILFLLADPSTGTFTVEKRIPLTRPNGRPLTGLPQKEGGEAPLDASGKPLAYDPYGMDPESIVQAPNGEYWIGEEYGPSVGRFSAEGHLLEMLKPEKGLPKVFEQARLNRGFEGAAFSAGKLYMIAQSPLDNPRSAGQKNSKKSKIVRLLEIETADRRTSGQFAYVLGTGKDLKIGDLSSVGDREFLLIEQNGKTGKKNIKRVVKIRLAKATNLQLLPEKMVGPGGSLEATESADLLGNGIIAADKEEVLDLAALGISESKVEGIDQVDDATLALITDNDFGLSGEWDAKTGKVEFKDEKSVLYLVHTK